MRLIGLVNRSLPLVRHTLTHTHEDKYTTRGAARHFHNETTTPTRVTLAFMNEIVSYIESETNRVSSVRIDS